MDTETIQLPPKKKASSSTSRAFCKALMFFPELNDTYIFIHEAAFYGVQHTLRAYPPLVVLHWKKRNWVYPIVINKNSDINISFYTLTLDQQIGILVHELSHIATYIHFSRRDIARFSFRYLVDKKFVRKIEAETDTNVIQRGAGSYLLAFRLHVLRFRMNNPYSETQDTYMMPDDLISTMKTFPHLYSEVLLKDCNVQFTEIKQIKSTDIRPTPISAIRKIKHSIKTIFAFIPAFIEMVYLVPIKKRYR